MAIELQQLREDYALHELDILSAEENPLLQFEKWFEEAIKAEIKEPNAMTLATVDEDGKPHARIVLLKGIDEKGFVFYTNYLSHKAQQIDCNSNTALLFLWLDLQRQIRIEGVAEKLSFEESERYFQSRPKASQIGAWSSPQSEVIVDRAVLEEKVKEVQEKYANQEVLPCPPHWGGYRVRPTMIEFWQGRQSRLHDRIQYQRVAGGQWHKKRLAP